MTFVLANCPCNISGISQLLLTRFWPNFKGKFLGPSWTYSNSHSDICKNFVKKRHKNFAKKILPKKICKKISTEKKCQKNSLQKIILPKFILARNKKICKKNSPKEFSQKKNFAPNFFCQKSRWKFILHITLEVEIWYLGPTHKKKINQKVFWMVQFDYFLVWLPSPIQLSWEEIQLTQNLGSWNFACQFNS